MPGSVDSSPRWQPEQTEFYIVGPNGLAESYPTQVRAGQRVSLDVGISNGEVGAGTYQLAVRAGSAELVRRSGIAVAGGDTWRGTISFAAAQAAGMGQIDIVLFRGDDGTRFRALRLWLEVEPSTGTPPTPSPTPTNPSPTPTPLPSQTATPAPTLLPTPAPMTPIPLP